MAANLFRAAQTEEKLHRDGIHGKAAANRTHFEVGTEVRQTIRDIGGQMPERLPAVEISRKSAGGFRGQLRAPQSDPADAKVN